MRGNYRNVKTLMTTLTGDVCIAPSYFFIVPIYNKEVICPLDGLFFATRTRVRLSLF